MTEGDRDCVARPHTTRRIVLTGGPGAGKTAVLEVVRNMICRHVVVLPEAASIVFGGGFPRGDGLEIRKCGQRAIGHVQLELERSVVDSDPAVVLCDRGVVDGLAYWPGPEEELWSGLGLDHASALARYDLVLHLAVPSSSQGYNKRNPVRMESAEQAQAIDRRITEAWRTHPNVVLIASSDDFSAKLARALALVKRELPSCCHDGKT